MIVALEERFWSKVDKSAGKTACWPWTAGKDSGDGYGRAWDGTRTRQAHALAWELARGKKVPDGKSVLHSCDNPPCCNPKHLRPGTPKMNTRDRIERDRLIVPYRDYDVPAHRRPTGARNGTHTHPETVMRGDKHVNAKVSSSDVKLMRKLRAKRHTLSSIAQQFGMSITQTSRIVTGASWKTVTR